MAKRRKSPLPPGAQRIIQQCARKLKQKHGPAFRSNADIKRIAGRLLVAMLPPHPARSGRPCEPHITRAGILDKRYRKTRPLESAEDRWNRICRAVIPDFERLPPSDQAAAKAKLKAAVRSRRNARRRRRKDPR